MDLNLLYPRAISDFSDILYRHLVIIQQSDKKEGTQDEKLVYQTCPEVAKIFLNKLPKLARYYITRLLCLKTVSIEILNSWHNNQEEHRKAMFLLEHVYCLLICHDRGGHNRIYDLNSNFRYGLSTVLSKGTDNLEKHLGLGRGINFFIFCLILI